HHHTDPKSSHYCVLTNFLNPILDRLHLWNFFERAISRTFGVSLRPDSLIAPLGQSPIPCDRRETPATSRFVDNTIVLPHIAPRFFGNGTVGYPSGQRGQTVNLLAYAFAGS